MHAIFRSGLAIASLGALILAPASVADAASTKVSVANLRGPLVNASFSVTDPSNCIETDTFVSANLPSYQQLPSAPVTTGVASVSIFEYDACTDTTLMDATGLTEALPAGSLQVSKQLDHASLRMTLPMTDIDTGATFDVDVDVVWSGTSDIHRDDENSNDFYGGGCHVLNRWKGSGRTATASGTVSDGVTNYTPDATQDGEIGYVIDGFEVIDCL
ncbi:MAG TPA: hypothetical protein VFI15_11415 [Candidatus Limnocylindrales bacterium]|jgi:hypothetical protein|nr:hypothetical protein [Candidatus Limnocylindrales bacterium]